jgi:formate-dependent nitrite reductase membrane component NrfD
VSGADGGDGRAEVPEGPLTATPPPADLAPREEPPTTTEGRETEWVADHDHSTRDASPALGTPGGPGRWRRAVEGAHVALARRGWGDAQWSFLFKADTSYAGTEPQPGEVAEANRRMRTGPVPPTLQGPFIKPPVWTWEVPLYVWLGGIASGSSFVALACDLAGDERSARTARGVALGAVIPAPLLLIADLGRPGRFLNMLRIFKPRSPMNMGAWCLAAFSTSLGATVGADLLGRRKAARAGGAVTAALGGYLGSYAGVLLAATAVPVWARSRLFLGPIFVSTATATGAAASRLAIVATGVPEGHPTRTALGTLETGAMLAELTLSSVNEHRLGRAGHVLQEGRAGTLFQSAKWLVRIGLGLRPLRQRLGPNVHHVASVCYLAGGLAFRYAWVEAGKASARDDEAVVRMARGRVTLEDEVLHGRRRSGAARMASSVRRPSRAVGVARLWTESVRRLSLVVEGVLRGVARRRRV